MRRFFGKLYVQVLIGVFATNGLGSIVSLGKLMGTMYITCILFVANVLGLISRLSGFSLWKFLKYIKDELFTVLGTSASELVVPQLMRKLEHAGISKPVAGMVLLLGVDRFMSEARAITNTIGNAVGSMAHGASP